MIILLLITPVVDIWDIECNTRRIIKRWEEIRFIVDRWWRYRVYWTVKNVKFNVIRNEIRRLHMYRHNRGNGLNNRWG